MSFTFKPTGNPEEDAYNFMIEAMMEKADEKYNGILTVMSDRGFGNFAELVAAQENFDEDGGATVTLFRVGNEETHRILCSHPIKTIVHMTIWVKDNDVKEDEFGLLAFINIPDGDIPTGDTLAFYHIKKTHTEADVVAAMTKHGYGEWTAEIQEDIP